MKVACFFTFSSTGLSTIGLEFVTDMVANATNISPW